MTDKEGTIQQQRATFFDKTPASATSMCPFKGPEVAIVPVRYALDRSRYDVAPDKLKPLPQSGKWADLPELKTRAYTLRQLYDGYLYVFDETAGIFHEYVVRGADANLARIVWTDAHLGQDMRTGSGEARPYLLYPRANRLHLAFSPMQWTWRLCEHMRSNAGSRARWMKLLDLAGYCTTMAEAGTLPLTRIAEVVADIDQGSAVHDRRFDDSSVPTTNMAAVGAEPDPGGAPPSAPVGADVYWLGSVPDKDSALFIALDNPLAMLTDLGLQLAGDQAAYRTWQTEHEHKVQMAKTVTNLCASSDEPTTLPVSVRDNVTRTQLYLTEVDDCLEQLHLEENEFLASTLRGDALMTTGIGQSREMKATLQAKYAIAPSDQDYESWKQRAKWRKEIDLKGARDYISQHQPTADRRPPTGYYSKSATVRLIFATGRNTSAWTRPCFSSTPPIPRACCICRASWVSC